MSHMLHSDKSTTFKRKRTAHACEECRSRKSRCDGGQPVCSKCSEMGFPCRDSQPKKASRPSIPSVQPPSDSPTLWLAGRLDNMEHLLERLLSRNDLRSPPCLPHTPPDSLPALDTQASDHVDGMGCMLFADDEDAGHFGPTSNATFLHQIVTALQDLQRINSLRPTFGNLAPALRSAWPPPSMAPSSTRNKRSAFTSHMTTSSSKLPSNDQIVALLQRYFQHTGDMFPYLHKPTILAYLGTDQHARLEYLRPVQRCLISTCLAFASVHGTADHNRQDGMHNARVYFEVARKTLPEITSQKCDVETIQALLLFLQYSQGTQRSSETWELIGAIVQRAFKTGLYRPAPLDGPSTSEMGIRTRTWWMVFMMDKMCSMTFGRPPLVPNSYMGNALPSSITSGLSETSYGLSDRTPAASAGSDLFLQTCELNLILVDVIETIYGCNIEDTLPRTLLDLQQHVVRIEGQLSEWKNQLPDYCRLLDLPETENIKFTGSGIRGRRTTVILSLRYLNLRSLLHGASIYRLLTTGPRRHDCPQLHTLHSSANLCIESAAISIKLISQAVQYRDLLPIWWFSAYYILTASLTIFAAIALLLKEPTHLQQYTTNDLLCLFQAALDSLDVLEQDSLVVDRCQQTLRRIIHTCWTVTGQYLPENASTGSLSSQNAPHIDQSDEIPNSDDAILYEASQAYPPFTYADPWTDVQVDLDFSWVNSMTENLQLFNENF